MHNIAAPVKSIGMAMVVVLWPAIAEEAGAMEIYSTGFEPAAFSPGSIDGQAGWFGSGKIQNGLVKSGTQALHINGSGGGGFATPPISTAIGGNGFSLQADYRRTGEPGQSGISLFGDTGFVAQIAEISSGFVLGNTDANTAPRTFALDTWHHLEIRFDFLADTMSAFVDGQSLGSLSINILPETTMITGIQLYSLGVGKKAQDIYFDNLSFATTSTVPDTSSSLTLLGLGCATLLGVRRRLPRSPACPRPPQLAQRALGRQRKPTMGP
jgi:hypothetical protein